MHCVQTQCAQRHVDCTEHMAWTYSNHKSPLCCTVTFSALRPYFNPFYINFELKYLETWLSICSLKTVGSEVIRWQRFKMLMTLKIFQHVCLNMPTDLYIYCTDRKSNLWLY